MAKVLIIGLDGATWHLLEPWARAGRLPRLAALMARGTWGPLTSTIPPLTLPAWSSFMTGRNPGAHGVYAFWRLGGRSYEPGGITNATDLRTATLWDLAGRAGRRVGVVNVPPSYPLRAVNGWIVGCMLTPPGEQLTEPAEVQDELGDYRIDVRAPDGLSPEAPGYHERAVGFIEALREQTERRAAATVRLMATRPTDLVSIVFYAPDRVQHFFWHYLDGSAGRGAEDDRVREALAAVFRTLDDAVGHLVDVAGPEADTIIVSDHGFTTKPAHSIRINRWLADAGLLRERPLWKLRRKVARRTLPRRWLARWDGFEATVNPAHTRAWAERIETTTAAIWVHVKGRYPLGCVKPGAEYEAIRTQIKDGLEALRDGTNRPVFRGVHRREELYRGPYVEEAPDLIAVCHERFGLVYQSLRRDLRGRGLFGPWGELGYTGTHHPAGIYLFAGPRVRTLGQHQTYPIESITPTALHLLGAPVPRSLDGPVCTSLLDQGFLAANPIVWSDLADEELAAGTAWRSREDEAHVADHLRALGYLE